MSLCRLTLGACGRRHSGGTQHSEPHRVLRAPPGPPVSKHPLPRKEPEILSPRAKPSGRQHRQAPGHTYLWNWPAVTIRSWEPAFSSVNTTSPSRPYLPSIMHDKAEKHFPFLGPQCLDWSDHIQNHGIVLFSCNTFPNLNHVVILV